MSWRLRHEGSPRELGDLSLPQIVEGLRDGAWVPTDEVKGPSDQSWQAIENHPALAEIAEEAGLDGDETARFLASREGAEEVVAEDMSARRIGINAVPCFIFERKYVVSGAQEAEFFFPLFDLLKTEQAAVPAS